MNLAEKIKHEDALEINLYKEGIFWIAYEQSAYALQEVKILKPTRKYVKVVKQDVVSVGFPDSVLRVVIPLFDEVSRTDTEVRLRKKTPIDLVRFSNWKSGLPLVESAAPVLPPIAREEPEVVHLIRSFPLATSTPLDCFQFVVSLKQKVS